MDIDAVISTADDAIDSKRALALKGYTNDKFVQFFVPKEIRRAPLINRGYYSRVSMVEKTIKTFINQCDLKGVKKSSQIVSIGCGLDTAFWRLHSEGVIAGKYFELDMPSVVKRKSRIISRTNELKEPLGESVTINVNSIDSPLYGLVSADLRNTKDVEEKLKSIGLDTSLPTLFISECVLIYLDTDASSAFIKWAASNFKCSVFLTYEQIRPHDSFGAIMIKNLSTRGCDLKSITLFPDLESQVKRYIDEGFERAKSLDMNDIYYKVLDSNDIKRISKLEMFDEFEEWHLIQAHYCFTVGVNNGEILNEVDFLMFQEDRKGRSSPPLIM